MGLDIGDRVTVPSEAVRDVTRARQVADSYAARWLRKAEGDTVAKAAKAASADTQGSLKRISVTESSEAFSSGRAKYLRERPDLGFLRVWDASLDKRTCPICRGNDGLIVGANEPFPGGEPGAVHAFCRCVWALLRSSRDGSGTLIEPVTPTGRSFGQVPAAPKGKLPSVVSAGGKLTVDAETKAWAKRLDDALGAVGRDGGQAARVELRAMLDRFGYKSKATSGVIKVGRSGDMAGLEAFANWDGSIVVTEDVLKHSRAALRKLQLGVDPGDSAQRLSVLLHEELHGASALSKTAYQGAGAALEEATTELAARRMIGQLIGRPANDIYGAEIDGLKAVISRYSKTKPEALAKKIDSAITALKSGGRKAETAAEHVESFVKALKLTPKQSASVLRDFTETEWWRPGAKAAPVKATAKVAKPKAAKPKATRARAPPAVKDPQARELLETGFSGAVPQSGLRPESFEFLRSGGKPLGGSPILKIRADGGVQIVDGRHRITLARERGDATIRARILVEGPRGGIKELGEHTIKLGKAGDGEQRLSPRGGAKAAPKTTAKPKPSPLTSYDKLKAASSKKLFDAGIKVKDSEALRKLHKKFNALLPKATTEERHAVERFTRGYDQVIRGHQRGLSRAELITRRKAEIEAKRAKAQSLGVVYDTYEQDLARAAAHVDEGIASAGHLETFLAKAGKADKVAPKVFRGLALDEATVSEMLSTGIVGLGNQTTSFSWTPVVASDFAATNATGEKIAVLLQVKHKSGVAIETLSQYSIEKEVLLPGSAKFKVKSIKRIDYSDKPVTANVAGIPVLVNAPSKSVRTLLIEAEEL